MAGLPSVDSLSTRFGAMSEQRDRLLEERGSAWPCSGDQSSYGNVLTGSPRSDDHRRSPRRDYQPSGSVKRTCATPVKPCDDSDERNILDDQDLLPFAKRESHSANQNNPWSGSQLAGTTSRPTFRWVADDSSEEVQRKPVGHGLRGKSGSLPYQSSLPSHGSPYRRPNPLLMALVSSIAARRGVPSPPVPQEVIIAFESHVAHGAFMLKFVPSGAPHERFFVVKILDSNDPIKTPEPALCWYRSSKSWTMKRHLPLADLIAVIDGGGNHPSVRKRMVHPGFIKGTYVDLKPTYLRDEFVVQLHFRSSRNDEELLAIKMHDRQSYVSWYIVMNFLSGIGSVSSQELE